MANTPIQTTYERYAKPLVAGQLADTTNCAIETGVNTHATPIPAGRAVRDSGLTRQGVRLGAAADAIRGIALMDERLPARMGVAYGQGEAVSVAYEGDIAVEVSQPVVKGRSCYAHPTTGALGMEDMSDDTSPVATILIPGSRFLTAAADGGIAVMRLAPLVTSIDDA